MFHIMFQILYAKDDGELQEAKAYLELRHKELRHSCNVNVSGCSCTVLGSSQEDRILNYSEASVRILKDIILS